MESIETLIREGKSTNRDVSVRLGETTMKAFLAYNDGDFAAAVDLFRPVKGHFHELGGSNAQRDIFDIFLIQAAIKSSKRDHHRLARNLLNERKMWKPNGPMTDRLMAKVLAQHGD